MQTVLQNQFHSNSQIWHHSLLIFLVVNQNVTFKRISLKSRTKTRTDVHTSACTKKFDYFCTHTTYRSLLFTRCTTQNIQTKKNMQLIQGFVHDRMWGAVGERRGVGGEGEARVKTIRTRSKEAEKGHGNFLQAIPITCNSYSNNY